MSNTESKYYSPEDFDFPKLFYDVLFLPELASQKIKYLREENSTKLFFYSILILFLSSLGLAASQGSLGGAISSVLIWFTTVIFISLFAWLLRPREVGVDFGSIFFFLAFAQAPLIFLGLGKLWENSAFPTTGPTVLCFAWSLILWGWALANSLRIGSLKAGFLIALTLLLPFIGVAILAVFLVLAALSYFL
jgi:hypothetical protein